MKKRILSILENKNYEMFYLNRHNKLTIVENIDKTLNRILSNEKYYKNNIISFKYDMANNLKEIEIKIIENHKNSVKYSYYYIKFE